MNRKKVCLVTVCVLSLLVTACSGTKEAKTETTQNGADSAVDFGSSGNKALENSNTGELTLLCSENSSMTSTNFSCATEQGLYYMPWENKELSDGMYGKHLMYIDYASAQEIYLCNNAGCKHDSSECMAVFTEDDLKVSDSPLLFVWQNYLYVFAQRDESGSSGMGMSYAGKEEEPGQEPACLYRMRLDGTDREKVLTFDEGLTLEDCVYGCGDNLYLVTKKVIMEKLNNGEYYNTASDREMVSVDTNTWKQTTLCKLEDDVRLAESCAGFILCQKTVWNDGTTQKEASEMDVDTWIEAYEKTTEEYLLLNPQDGSTKQLATVSNANLSSAAAKGQKVYLSEEGTSGIRVIDVVTGEESILIPEESKWIWKIYEDSILCVTLEAPETEVDESDHSLYFADLNTGELHHCTLVNKTLGWDLEIVAETEDSFLVIYDYDAIDNGDGSYEITQEYYGLITKEDLYASRDNYRPIQMVDQGK